MVRELADAERNGGGAGELHPLLARAGDDQETRTMADGILVTGGRLLIPVLPMSCQ